MKWKAHRSEPLFLLTLRQRGRAALLAAIPGMLIIVISLIRTITASEVFQQHQQDALEVNILGRQRMLSQKYLKEVLLSTWKVQADYDATRNIMDQTAQALLEGGTVRYPLSGHISVRLQPIHSTPIRNLLLRQTQQLETLERQTNELNRQIRENRVSPQLLTTIVTHGDTVLNNIDQALTLFQSKSNSNLRTRLYTESLLGMLVSLLGMYVTSQVLRTNKALKQENEMRRQTEAELRISEARFHSAFDYSFIGMALASLEGRWLEVNEPFCNMLGYTQEEMLSMSYRDHTHPDDLEADRQYEEQLTQASIAQYHYEKRYIHKNGSVIWVFLSGSLVFDEQDQPLYYVAQIQDITPQKQAAEALQKSETMFRSIAETSHESIVLTDANGLIIFWNPVAEAIFGYTQDEVLQKPVTLLLPERYHHAYLRDLQRIRMGAQPKLMKNNIELAGIRKNSTEFPMEISLSSWKTEDSLFLCGIIRDLSEKKRYEQKVQSLTKRNQLLKNAVIGKEDGIFNP